MFAIKNINYSTIFIKNKDLTFDYLKFNNLTVNGNLQKNNLNREKGHKYFSNLNV